MDDVTKVFPGGFKIPIGDTDYLIDGIGSQDMANLIEEMSREARKTFLKPFIEMKAEVIEANGEDGWSAFFNEKVEEASRIEVGLENLEDFMSENNNIIFMLWLLIERRYPAKVTRGDIMAAVIDGQIDEQVMADINRGLDSATGKVGNSRGPRKTQSGTKSTSTKSRGGRKGRKKEKKRRRG